MRHVIAFCALALALFLFTSSPSMAGPFGGGGGQPATPVSSGPGSPNSVTGPYPNDGSRRMPGGNSLSALEAGRRKRAEMLAKSGRSSTRLAGSPGTQSYVNNLVGGAN